nr:cell differentiation protein RCD1 homolog isoform X1 [Tanacetum cinerariifolium]
VATLILGRIFSAQEGKTYIGMFVDRFYFVTKVLNKLVDEFSGIPEPVLLKNILICYLRLSELSRCCDALKICYPLPLRNPAYLNYICESPDTPDIVHYLLQVETVPVCLRCMEMGGKLTKSNSLSTIRMKMSNTISEDWLARCLKVKEIIDASIARIDSIRNDKAEEEISAKEAKESSYEGANNIIGKENGSKKEKNKQPTVGPTRVEPKPRQHNRMVEETEFYKKFVVSTSRTKKGPSTPPNYSSRPSTPLSYSSGPSTPPNYSLGSSKNAECSNCKHLEGAAEDIYRFLSFNFRLVSMFSE